MANNRLYIQDQETGEKFLLCKGFSNWSTRFNIEDLNKWLENRDISCVTGSDKTNLVLVTDS